MDIDYKALFNNDKIPRMIVVQHDEEGIQCLEANIAAQNLNLPELISEIFPENKLSDRNEYNGHQIGVKVVDQEQSIFELSLSKSHDAPDPNQFDIFSSVFDSSDIGILVTNEEGNIIKFNRGFTRLFGWNKEQILNKPFAICIADEDKDRAIYNHQKFIKNGIRSSGEIKILNANQSVSETLCTLTTLDLNDGQKVQITTIIDITFRKKMERSLREAKEQAESSNRAKSSFLANMSHELRTPLNAIIGFSEMLINQMYGDLGHTKYGEYSKDIHNSACHLLEIINEILDMSRIEAGSIKLAQDEVLLSELIETVTRMLAPQQQEKNIALDIALPENIPTLRIDSRLIRQALINILSNAIKYSGENSKISITADFSRNEDLLILFKDEGMGIPEEKLAHVMKPFGRVEDVFKKKSDIEGTGLGLPIANGMINLHGGALKISSKEGSGTIVSLTIPKYRVVPSKNKSEFPKFNFEQTFVKEEQKNTSLA